MLAFFHFAKSTGVRECASRALDTDTCRSRTVMTRRTESGLDRTEIITLISNGTRTTIITCFGPEIAVEGPKRTGIHDS